MELAFLKNWKSQVKKGALSYIVMNILKDKELYGYELIEDIRNYTEIEVAEGTLYPLMNRLKQEALVSSKWVEQKSGIPRKYYCLTELGSQTLEEMRTHWNSLANSISKISE